MDMNYGQNRVLEPRGYFPVSAWSLDNSKKLKQGEIRISVDKIKIEEDNFRQLCNLYDYDIEKIKKRIKKIVKSRRKLHNHLTDSGGICMGTVDEIHRDYNNRVGLKVGDRIVGVASLTSLPLHIDEIKSIDFNYGQIEVSGYCILFSSSPVVKIKGDIKEEILLSAYDESGSIAKAGELARNGNKMLILGSNILTVLIYAATMRHTAPIESNISVCLYRDETSALSKDEIYNLLLPYVDQLYILKQTSPQENFKYLQKNNPNVRDGKLYDYSVICSNMLGMETIGVLLTKQRGTLFFTNLVNNYNLTILMAESLGKHINAISLEEYTENFHVFTYQILDKIKSNTDKLHKIYSNNPIAHRFHKNYNDNFNVINANLIDGYVYNSKFTKQLLKDTLNIAKYDCNVMILGETGVGKERILDIIYKNSSRNGNKCIKINCSAISESLAESELFGYEDGAFTGAKLAGRKGYFELANNGILFLDEVGDLPLSLQAKLLRVLQEGQFYRVGGECPIDVNVRVISASNKNIRELVKKGEFREDLYYRLNICEINILPLRERLEDIDPLVVSLSQKYNDRYMVNKVFTADAVTALKAYSWPGNIREFDNVVHRLVITSKNKHISETDVNGSLKYIETISDCNMETENKASKEIQTFSAECNSESFGLDAIIEQHEKVLIKDALMKCSTTREAAKLLKISQSQLMRKKRKYNL